MTNLVDDDDDELYTGEDMEHAYMRGMLQGFTFALQMVRTLEDSLIMRIESVVKAIKQQEEKVS